MPEPDNEQEIEQAGVAHALWSGSISFGLLSLPVDLFSAARAPAVPLRTVDRNHRLLARRYYCPEHDRLLSRDEIVRGYEIEKDRYVVLSDEELATAAPEKSRAIDLRRFVRAEDLDPLYFKRSYVLTPGNEAAGRAYRLLAATMERSGRIGIATFVMRGKEYLVALLAENGILRAETLRFPDELREADAIDLPRAGKPQRQEVVRFLRAIAELATDEVDVDELRDGTTRRLQRLIDEKLERGVDVERAPAPGEADTEAEIIDLMEVLKRRLQPDAGDGAQQRERSTSSAKRPSRSAERRDEEHDDLSARSKSELYERAKALRVPGRSRMDKDDLVRALREAEG